MKIRVELDYDFSELRGLESAEDYYKKYFNRDGILFHDETESIYYDIDFPMVPMEGQRVSTMFHGHCIVTYALINLHPSSDDNDYYRHSIISVREE